MNKYIRLISFAHITMLLILGLLMAACAPQATPAGLKFVTEWGTKGTGDGQFQYIEDLAFDKDGNVVVTDALKKDVQVFTRDGTLVKVFGTDGTGQAALEKPEGIAVDDQGNFYVADYLSGYVQKYDPNYNHLLTFSGFGSEPGQTAESEFMDIDNGLLYLAEAGNNRISVFSLDGEFKFSFGSEGNGSGQMRRPEASKVGSDGTIYVADYGNHRIQVYTSKGEFLSQFSGEGIEPGRFRNVTGIALDKYDNIYACDLGNNRLQVFDKDGNFKFGFGTGGNQPGEFENLHGLIVDEDGFVYVADTGNNRIQKFQIVNFGP